MLLLRTLKLGYQFSLTELLKVKFGSAVHSDDHDNVMVSIPGLRRGREPKEISVKSLIIEHQE